MKNGGFRAAVFFLAKEIGSGFAQVVGLTPGLDDPAVASLHAVDRRLRARADDRAELAVYEMQRRSVVRGPAAFQLALGDEPVVFGAPRGLAVVVRAVAAG